MSVHEVLEYGPIVAHDEGRGLLVTVNGAYLNLWIESGDGFENTACRHLQSRTGGRDLREVSVAKAIELAEQWIEDVRSGEGS